MAAETNHHNEMDSGKKPVRKQTANGVSPGKVSSDSESTESTKHKTIPKKSVAPGTKPKTPDSTTQPPKTSQKKTVAKKIATPQIASTTRKKPEIIRETIPRKEEIGPDATANAANAISESGEKKADSSSPEKLPFPTSRIKTKRKREPSSRTISQVFYRKIKERSIRKKWFQIVVLLLVGLAAFEVIMWYVKNRIETSDLLKLSTQAFIALENDRLDDANLYLSEILTQYKTFHIDHPDWWFQQDVNIFTTMLRVAQCWRSLDDIQKGIETYQAVCLHNSEGPNSWIGKQLDEEMADFVTNERWTDAERQEIYSLLLQTDPATWGLCGSSLVKATEQAGLKLVPMKERIENADIIVYGTPMVPESLESNSMTVDGKLFYLTEHNPGEVEIDFPATLKDYERQRLQWYTTAQRECLIFCKTQESRMILTGIEGIVLSEKYSLEWFNALIE